MPKSGDELSILGFGCMRLPMQDGVIDEERATAQVRSAIDRGVTYLDTAWPYHGGESEPFVGRALSGGYRDKVRLATKLPTWLANTRADMDAYLDAQMKRLRTGRIDYYLVHALDGASWDKMEALGVAAFLDAAKKDGRIVNAEPGLASQCLECGQCLEKCPQGIAIPEVLKRVAAEMEDDRVEERRALLKRTFLAGREEGQA